MIFKKWKQFCLCADEPLFPAGAAPCGAPFAPLVFLVKRDPAVSRGLFAIHSLAELYEKESVSCLRPCMAAVPADTPEGLDAFVRAHGASVLNVSFARAFSYLEHWYGAPKRGLRVNLVGLGDVGGTVLMGLKLLGAELSEIGIFDPNAAQCARYEMELNQVLPVCDGQALPRVCMRQMDELFDCDLLAFTASRGVPGLGTDVRDVRMAQFAANRAMLTAYAKMARETHFMGLFCQISDPVDHLSRAVFLESNRAADGSYDYDGLLPEQVQGFGLGVMAARASYFAEKEKIDFSNGRVYGPHGEGLLAANDFGAGYDDVLSVHLTELARTANLRVRELGFKPYLAPGLSSAAISILRLVRGEAHNGAVPLDGAYFGCRSRMTRQGIELEREEICPALMRRIEQTHAALRRFDYE